MLKFIGTYSILELLLIIGAILFTWWRRKKRLRSKAHKPPKDFFETNEMFIDPTTGVKQRVWFNPKTGERYYETLEE